MSFGRLCTTQLPTLVGTFTMHALPERVAMGQREGREIVGLMEHAAYAPQHFDPTQPVKIHVVQENVFEDLFVGLQGHEHPRLIELLDMINGRKNEMLIVTRTADTPGLIALKNAAPQAQPLNIASPNQIAEIFIEHLGIRRIADIIHQPSHDQQGIAPEEVATQFGKFKVKTKDVAERAVMPAIAWSALFPDDAREEGKQPIVIVPKKHIALMTEPLIKNGHLPFVRIHSSCFTAMCGSKSCDCGQQFNQALEMIATNGGIMLHHDAEGRGAGLSLKALQYVLKSEGFSTYQAMHVFGFRDDEREYSAAVQMVNAELPNGFILATNNTDKLNAVINLGGNVKGTAKVTARTIYPEMVKYLGDKGDRSHPEYAALISATPK